MDRTKSPTRGYTIGIIIFAIVLIVLVGLLIYFLVFNKTTSSSGTSNGSVGATCATDSNCAAPLVCDATSKTCKRKQGDVCASNTDCVTGTACSNGKCLATYGGSCTTDSDCASPGACVGNGGTTCSTVLKVCKNGTSDCLMPGLTSSQVTCDTKNIPSVNNTTTCNVDGDCPTNSTCNTTTHTCQIPVCSLLPGMVCSSSNDCTSKEVCDTFVTPNPQCRVAPTYPCKQNSDCEQGASCVTIFAQICDYRPCKQNSDCFSDETCTNKKCIPSICNTNTDCTNVLGSTYSCVSDSNNKNRCVIDGNNCPSGCTNPSQACNGQICELDLGKPCGSNFDCASGICDQTLAAPVCIAKTCSTVADCSNPYPACKFAKCALCTGNSDCPSSAPTCDTVHGTCS